MYFSITIRHLERKAAIRYCISLLSWKGRSRMPSIGRSFLTASTWKQIKQLFPKDLEELMKKTTIHDFVFHGNVQKKLLKEPLMLKALWYFYFKGFYCRKCFLQKHVVETIRKEDNLVCPRCSSEYSYLEESLNKKIKFRKNMVDHEIKDIMKSYGFL